jgi:8-oxo-dGTP pyrophosphatase MutT (NUDIX family)
VVTTTPARRVPVRQAATVMLVRDTPSRQLEVFMLRRHPGAVFAPGAYVFPGGAVDNDDASVAVVGRSRAGAEALMGRDGALDHFVAAARESFEEAGFLITNTVTADLLAARDAVNAGERKFGEVLRSHGAAVDAGAMHVFSHWRTPVGAPRRFDTWFFVGAAPTDQVGAHDDTETVHSEWIQPSAMLHRWRRGEVDLVFPTMRTVRVLAQFPTAAALLGAVRAAEDDAAGGALRVVDDSSGQRVALDDAERATAPRGWRALRSRWRTDARQEAIDRAGAGNDEGEGAA